MVAQRSPEIAFTSLAHYIDLEWMIEAYHRTRKDGCTGIDDVTGKQYAGNLNENLQNLLDRLKSGTYKTPPSSGSILFFYARNRRSDENFP